MSVVKPSSTRLAPSSSLPRAGGRPPALSTVPPLLPLWLPLVIAAIVTGGLFAWWFPPVPGGARPPARFTDITVEAGLGAMRVTPTEEAPTTLAGGVVCFDYDGDGDTDLFFVNGAPWWQEAMAKQISRGSCALYRNDGRGQFADVTSTAGLEVELQGVMAAAGDYDNDGRPDLFIAGIGTSRLFRNLGGGHFEDVTESAGVGGAENTWSSSAVWLDVDNDGRLDLIVGHYARWPREVELRAAFTVALVGRSYGAPTGFVGAFPSVYRNLGDGKFAELPDHAGLQPVDVQTGFPAVKLLAIAPVDVNGDGRIDLLLSYHTSESQLFLNEGGGTFRSWVGTSDRRQEGIAAGLATAGSLSLTRTGGPDERAAAWRAVLGSTAIDRDVPKAWLNARLGAALLDYDLDGRIDYFAGNGRAEPDVNRFEGGREFAGAPALWWNEGTRWVATTPPDGDGENAWATPLMARGVATADIDGDGDLDVVIAQTGAAPRLLRNDQRLALPWLQIALVARPGARSTDGARVEVHTPGRLQVQTKLPAMGLMAQSADVLTFGLGDDARVRKIVVQWPDGTRQEIRPPAINQRLVLTAP